MNTHLIWFRADLRVNDNLALAAACADQDAAVIALYIATPKQWEMHNMSPRQAAFILKHLNELQKTLAEKGIPLIFREVDDFTDSVAAIKAVCKTHKVTRLFYNYQYEINERLRDAAVEKSLKNVVCQGFDDNVILPPGAIMTGSQKMYKVLTPFKNAYIHHLKTALLDSVYAPKTRKSGKITDSLKDIRFSYPQHAFDEKDFPIDEKTAISHLRQFCTEKAEDYGIQRDFPAKNGTSKLSSSLTVGVLSPRQCLHRLLKIHPHALEGKSGAIWLNELIWREFYRHLLTFYPDLCKHRPFLTWTNNIHWKNNSEDFSCWKQGKTGFPIVDAAMHQLNETGWMHNRLRMIVASFLVKDLLIDWRWGERYFISQLIDGDLASNNGGWQWAASTGVDPVPYFRIFNPTTQSERFDKRGEFIRQWIPELADVPENAIHEPWVWADKNGVKLKYPRPIVDHKTARKEALRVYQAAEKSK